MNTGDILGSRNPGNSILAIAVTFFAILGLFVNSGGVSKSLVTDQNAVASGGPSIPISSLSVPSTSNGGSLAHNAPIRAGHLTPTPAAPRPHYVSCGQFKCNLDEECVSVSGLSVSPGNAQATISWIDSSILTGGPSYSNFILYSTNPNNLGGTIPEGSSTASLSNLYLNVIYYFLAGASRTCGTITAGYTVAGCFFTSSTGGGVCPLGSLGLNSISVVVGQYYNSATIGYSVTPTTLKAGSNYVASVWINGQTITPATNPQIVSALTPGDAYKFFVNVSAPGYVGASYVGYFGTGCTPSVFSGTVTIASSVPPTGIYGANIIQGGTYVAAVSDVNGNWEWSPGCSSFQYSLAAEAIGFDPGSASQGTLAAGGTANINSALPIWSTWDVGHAFFNLNQWYSNGVTPTLSSSTNVQNSQVATLSGLTSGSFPPDPPSGKGAALELSGTDTSSPSSPHSQAVYNLGPTPNPFLSSGSGPGPSLSGPLLLTFAVFVPDPGHQTYSSINTHFSVDAILSDGTTVDQEIGVWGDAVLSSIGTGCTASQLVYTVDQWQTMSCDLSDLRGVTITQLQLVYDNNNAGSSGSFVAFFDGISLTNPDYSDTIVNGGFEEPGAPYGWSDSGVATIVSSPDQSGNQSLRVGSSAHAGDSGITSVVSQQFRVPNTNLSNLIPTLSFYYEAPAPNCGSGCQAGSQVTVNLYDSTLSDNINILTITNAWTNTWTQVSMNMQSYEGDVVTFQIVVAATQGYQLYAYFDTIQFLLQGETLTEKQGSTASGVATTTLKLAGGIYRPSCIPNNWNTVINVPMAVGSSHGVWASLSQKGQYYAEGVATMGLNLWNVTNYCWGNLASENYIYFGLNVAANATGPVYSQGVQQGIVGIQDLCVLTKFTPGVGSDAVVAPAYSAFAVIGLGGSGPPNNPPGFLYDSPDLMESMSITDIIGEMFIMFATEEIDPIVLFAIGADLAFEFFIHYAYTPTQAPGSCNNPPAGYTLQDKWNTSFNGAGELPTYVKAAGEIAVNVGCNMSTCHGGSYALSAETIADSCQLYSAYQCNTTLFETVTTVYNLTIVDT
jgi:hypothetical protein